MKELISKVLANQPTINNWKDDFRSEEYNLASDLNKKLFGMPLNRTVGCECVADLYRHLNSKHQIKNIMNKENAQFQVISGKLLMAPGIHLQLSEHSSDEDCIKFLKAYPSHIVNFSKFPENWEEIVGTEEVIEETEENEEVPEGFDTRKDELEAMKVAQLKALILSMELEIPEGNKSVLVQFILDNEAK